MIMGKLFFRTFLSLLIITATGCAKNVDRIEFTKWGNSFVPPRTTGFDTTAQGGGIQNTRGGTPMNNYHMVPKASVGGTYHRTFATSPSYRMVGGFHTP